jgi:hypothetical protein
LLFAICHSPLPVPTEPSTFNLQRHFVALCCLVCCLFATSYAADPATAPKPPLLDPGPAGPPANIPSDAIILFDGKDLSKWPGVQTRIPGCSSSPTYGDSRIEFRDGSTEGAILAAVTVKPTGAWNEWIEFTALVKAPAHRTDLCVTFSGVQTNRLLNLDWVQFNR